MLSAGWRWGFCFSQSTCRGSNWSLSALNVIGGTFKERGWRLVTNLTKLGPVSTTTQQARTMRFETIMLILPVGSSRKGHRRRCWQFLETVAESTTHPSAPWELRDEGTNNPGSIKLWLMPFFLGLMSDYFAYGSMETSELLMWDRQTHSRQRAIQDYALQTLTSSRNLLCFHFFSVNRCQYFKKHIYYDSP